MCLYLLFCLFLVLFTELFRHTMYKHSFIKLPQRGGYDRDVSTCKNPVFYSGYDLV
jgi:hypothetical protein